MAEDETEWGVVLGCTTLFLAIHGVLAYTSCRVLANREALHIANRNLYVIFTDVALISLTTVSILGRWVLLALKARAAYKPFLVFCHFSLCYALTMHGAEDLFKIYLVVIKFREAGARVHEDGCTVRVTRWLGFDMRTRRGQHKFLRACYAFALICTIPLFTSGDKLCFRLCKRELPVFGAYWIYPVIPIMSITLPIVALVVKELKKLGPIHECLGLLQELHDLFFSAGILFSLASTITMAIDLGLLGERHVFWAGVLQMQGICCILYISQWRLRSKYGYGLSTSDHTASVNPTLGPAAQTPSFATSAGVSRSTFRFTTGEVHEERLTDVDDGPSGPSEPYYDLLKGLMADVTVQEDLFYAARGYLSEEAVRCAVAILKLRDVPLDKEARKAFRNDWKRILDSHLIDGAPYPVSIDESARRQLCRLVLVTCRRKVLFIDDCRSVNELFMKVLGQLAPVLRPVLTRTWARATGALRTTSPVHLKRTGGRSGGMPQLDNDEMDCDRVLPFESEPDI